MPWIFECFTRVDVFKLSIDYVRYNMRYNRCTKKEVIKSPRNMKKKPIHIKLELRFTW